MITILGAGGVIADELAVELARGPEPVRLVSRSPKPLGGAAQTVAADVSNASETSAAVEGSTVVYLTVGLTYDLRTWRELWPRIMRNTIDACKRANARLVFFDNVYMYGPVAGAMTEATPFNPTSRKGEVRAQIATMLLEEMGAGNVQAIIARSADFYGPGARTGVANVLVFDNLARGKAAYWLVDARVPHSFTYTRDAARSLIVLARSSAAWNQTWHLPTATHPPTGREFIDLAAQALGAQPRRRVLIRPMIKVAGWFDPNVRELYEMLYQYDRSYLFDSTKFSTTFRTQPTSYADGIAATAASYEPRAVPAAV